MLRTYHFFGNVTNRNLIIRGNILLLKWNVKEQEMILFPFNTTSEPHNWMSKEDLFFAIHVINLKQLSILTKTDSLFTSSVIGAPNFPQESFKLNNKLKRNQVACKICRENKQTRAANGIIIHQTLKLLHFREATVRKPTRKTSTITAKSHWRLQLKVDA